MFRSSRLLCSLTCTVFVVLSHPVQAGDLPRRELTPGAINAEIHQADIDATICARGWTKTIRPPAYYTNKLKKQQLTQYAYADQNPKNYEEDHLIPLELGGHPTDPSNLWPQPWNGDWSAKEKDQLENKLKRLVCSHQITLTEAQAEIAYDWIAAYKKFVR